MLIHSDSPVGSGFLLRNKIKENKIAAWFILFFLLPLLCTVNTAAQTNKKAGKFYGGLNAGTGYLHYNLYNDSKKMAPFVLEIYGGYSPATWLRTGISLGGMTIESGNLYYPQKGVGMSEADLQVMILPLSKQNLFVNMQAGLSNYWTNHDAGQNLHGFNARFGIGYEIYYKKKTPNSFVKKMATTFGINYGFGKLNDVDIQNMNYSNQHYSDIAVTIGFIL